MPVNRYNPNKQNLPNPQLREYFINKNFLPKCYLVNKDDVDKGGKC